MSDDSKAQPFLKFGIITDIQYANCDDRVAAYDPSKTRYYRHSLSHVESAFNTWKNSPEPINFTLQLGDIIDGLNVNFQGSHEALKQTLEKFESHSCIPTFHTVGNHELYNFKRHELACYFNQSIQKMNIPPEIFIPKNTTVEESSVSSPILYYKFCPHPFLKFISLDCFDVSVLGHDRHHPAYKEAANILESHHKHNDFKLWDCDGPLQGLDLRFQQMNGAVGKDQLRWLDEELRDSDSKGQKVIVFGHVSLSPESTDYTCLLWNYEEVMDCFHGHQSVVAYFSGHSHASGYSIDGHGIHYVVFAGVIETPPDDSAFATVSVYPEKLEIQGHGREKSHVLHFLGHFPHFCDDTNPENEQVISVSIKVEV